MIKVTDQLGAEVNLNEQARRIVSLVPSQTELLHYLGLDEEVIGITKFCIHPDEWFRSKTRVGGTKDFKPELIRSLKPDLVLANKEENQKELLEDLAKDLNVWTSNIHTLDEALEMVKAIGLLTGTEERAEMLIEDCRRNFSSLKPINKSKKVLYLIWRNPWMCAGNDTFIHDMLLRCGMVNACNSARYPELTSEQIKEMQPELILLSSEPYPFKEMHIAELLNIYPHAEVKLVDGEYFSWYGSRMKDAPEYFAKCI